jgi:hypothetical protein
MRFQRKTNSDKFQDIFAKMPSGPFQCLSSESKAALEAATDPPHSLPAAARLYAPELSPTTYAPMSGNTMTIVEITLALADQEVLGWKMLEMECNKR